MWAGACRLFTHNRVDATCTAYSLRAIAYANPEKKTLAGVAHIWQELLYEEGCTALKVLDELGRSVESMRTALQNAVGEIERPIQAQHIASSSEPITQQEAESIRQNTVSSQNADGEQKEKQDPLEAYARNLTQAAMRHELEPLIGREKELDSMIQILGKKTKITRCCSVSLGRQVCHRGRACSADCGQRCTAYAAWNAGLCA